MLLLARLINMLLGLEERSSFGSGRQFDTIDCLRPIVLFSVGFAFMCLLLRCASFYIIILLFPFIVIFVFTFVLQIATSSAAVHQSVCHQLSRLHGSVPPTQQVW